MKKRILICSLVGLAIFAFPVVINLFACIPTPWTQDDNDWIGFFGSYAGALIGGLIAYLIARYQIKDVMRQEREKRIIQQLPTLIQLKYEIEKAKTDIQEKIKAGLEYKKNQNDQTDTPVEAYMKYLKFNSIKMNKEIWYNIDKIEDVSFMQELIEFREDFIRMQDIMLRTYQDIIFEIHQKQLESQKPKTEINLNSIKNDIQDLSCEAQQLEKAKLNEWKNLSNGTYLRRIEQLEERLNTLLQDIYKLKKSS